MVLTLVVSFLAAVALLIPSHVLAAPIEAHLQLAKLWCQRPTWEGKDHIYLIVVGKNTQGQDLLKVRLPSSDGHWYMDAKPTHNTLDGVNLWSGSLTENETVDLTIFVMEEDKGVPDGWVGLAQAALKEMPGPPSHTIGSTLNVMGYLAMTFNIEDVDDFPGSFHVRLQNRSGQVTTTWRAGEHAEDIGEDKPNTMGQNVRGHGFALHGDNSSYRAYLTTTPPEQP